MSLWYRCHQKNLLVSVPDILACVSATNVHLLIEDVSIPTYHTCGQSNPEIDQSHQASIAPQDSAHLAHGTVGERVR